MHPSAVPEDTFEMRLAIARFHAGGLSAREAAMRVGVSGQTWRNWEAGHSGPARKPAMLAYIASQLGVDESWLRDGGPLRLASGPGPDDGLRLAGGSMQSTDGLDVQVRPLLVAA